MDFQFSNKVRTLQQRLTKFMDDHIYPLEPDYADHVEKAGGWTTPPIMDALKGKAREEGLWKLLMQDDEYGAGLKSTLRAPYVTSSQSPISRGNSPGSR